MYASLVLYRVSGEFQVQIVLSHTPPTYIINHIILLTPPPLCFLSRMRSCSWTKPNTVRFTRSESSRCGAHSLLLKLEKTEKKEKSLDSGGVLIWLIHQKCVASLQSR